MWENIIDPGRPQMTIWRMRIACWIPKATNTHSEFVILIAFPLQQRFKERASMSRYTYRVTQKTGTFEKPNKNWRNPRKEILTEIEPLQPLQPLQPCHPVCVACSAECDRVAFCRACNTNKVTQKNGNFWNVLWQWKNAYVEEDAMYRT